MDAIDKLAWELTISEQMIKCKTADDLLIETIRFFDEQCPSRVQNYNDDVGALRFKIDQYLNKNNTDIDKINKRLKQYQEVK